MIWRILGAVVVAGGLYLAYDFFMQDGDTLPDGAALVQVSVPDFEGG